jgi:peptidyl-prolyl cis-trans isomerase SurA
VRTAAGIHLFMVCDRIESNSPLPSRDEIRQALTASRADQVARHYLRDLRRTAFVDIRI